MTEDGFKRKLAAILSVDVEGYSLLRDQDGSTIYKPENASSLNGKWFVKDGKYCSDFGYGENCYQVGREGNSFHWIYANGTRVKFSITK